MTRHSFFVLAALVISDALALGSCHLWLRFAGGAVLFCSLPGLALVNLVFPDTTKLTLLPRSLLSSAASYALAILVLFLIGLAPGGVSLWHFVVAESALTVAFVMPTFARRDKHIALPAQRPNLLPIGRHLALLLPLLVAFRFWDLGYSEFCLEETPILTLATRIAAGPGSVLLEHQKGPAEVLTALGFVLIGDGYNEFILRFPFALTSLIATLLIYVFGREAFGQRAGFLAAVLLALDGAYLAHCRFVQYQGLLVLMSVAATYCFWRATRPQEQSLAARYVVLGSIFFALACFSHYGGVLVLPTLLILFAPQVRAGLRQAINLAATCGALIFTINAPFYLLFLFSAHFEKARAYYFSGRLGWSVGIHNNLPELTSYLIFPNSIYFVALMCITALGALALLGRSHSPLLGSAMVLAIGILQGILAPGATQLGSINFGFLFFVPFLALLFWRQVDLAHRAVWLWLLTSIMVLSFFARQPFTHWYVVSPAWALLSGLALAHAFGWLERRAPIGIRYIAWLGLGVLMALCAGYLYIFFLQRYPEYANEFPKYKTALYWTPLESQPVELGLSEYGAPTQTAWETVGYLYRTGALRGSSRITLNRSVAAWYVGYQWDKYGQDFDNILYTGKSKRVEDSLAKIEQDYTLAGRIWVGSVPKVLIYARKNAAAPPRIVDYHQEQIAPYFDQVVTLASEVERLQLGVNAETFSPIARLVEESSREGDEVIFTAPGQIGLFSYHYSGQLPYRFPERTLTPAEVSEKLHLRPPAGKAYLLFWGRPGSVARIAWDAWLQTEPNIVSHVWYGPVGMAIYNAKRDTNPPAVGEGAQPNGHIRLPAHVKVN